MSNQALTKPMRFIIMTQPEHEDAIHMGDHTFYSVHSRRVLAVFETGDIEKANHQLEFAKANHKGKIELFMKLR